MSAQITSDEMLESLTGFDELAIEKAFDADWQTLVTQKQTMFLRALIFVQLRRDGKSDKDAKNAVMELSLKAANDFFADDEVPDLDPDQPDSESGKDDSADD